MTQANGESSSLTVPDTNIIKSKAALRASTCLTAIAHNFSGLPCDVPIPEYCELIGFQQETDGDYTFTARVDLSDLVDPTMIVSDFEPPS